MLDGAGALLGVGETIDGLAGTLIDPRLRAFLESLDLIDAQPVAGQPQIVENAMTAWSRPGATVEAYATAYGWLLMTSHERPAGGRCYVCTDISARKQSDSLAGILGQQCPVPIIANDMETGEVVYHNGAARALFEIEFDHGSVAVSDIMVDPIARRETAIGINRNRTVESRGFQAQTMSGQQLRLDGAIRKVSQHGRQIALSVVTSATDCVDPENDETALNQAVQDAIQSLTESFAVYDQDNRLRYCNDAFRDMFVHANDFAQPGMQWELLLRESARRGLWQDLPSGVRWLDHMLEITYNFSRDAEITRSDGRWYRLSLNPTPSGGFSVAAGDITEAKKAAEAELEGDELLRKVLDACPANIVMTTIGDGEVIYRSPAATQFFGSRSDARAFYANPETRADFLTELLPTGRIDALRTDAIRADGQKVSVALSARLVDYKGEDVIVSHIVDMTEIDHTRAGLADANRRMRDAIESLDEGFAYYDADGYLKLFNRKYKELHSFVSEHIHTGAAYEDVLRAMFEARVLNLLQGGPRTLEEMISRYRSRKPSRVELQHKDGRWYSVGRNPTSDGGFVITRLDITEQKRAEELEREADQMIRRVLDACPVMIIMATLEDGEVIYSSRYAIETFGEPARLSDLECDKTKGKLLARLVETEALDGYEMTVCRADGQQMQVLASARVVEFKGYPVVVTHFFDLTERVAMEGMMARQRETLHQSEKLSALGELLAGVAHELNNPLSVVVGHALMMQEEIREPASRARIEKIAGAAERCAKIVKTFLAMARQRPARIEAVSVNEIVETALDVAGYRLRSAGGTVVKRLLPNLPRVMADQDQIAQVFTNIVVNAEHVLVEMGEKARLVITTRFDATSNEVVIKFQDNGPGVPEHLRARIFEPFFTTKEVGAGTGIGLAFSHRIVESHNGRIYLKSSQDAGASFFVRLPVATGQGEDGDCSDANGKIPQAKRVLVVDDEPDVVDLIADILARDRYEVIVAGTAQEALERISETTFHAVLTDLNMPEMSGLDLLAAIRERAPELAERVAFVTGDTISPGVAESLERTGRTSLEKPVSPTELRALIRDLVSTANTAGVSSI